jgi:hypothetical protein
MTKKKLESVEFLASLPPIQSAIMVDGTGDSMTIKLQIPLNQCPQALRLNLMTQKILRVIVTEESGLTKVDKTPKKRDIGRNAT